MKLCKARLATGETHVGVVEGDQVWLLDLDKTGSLTSLSDLLHADQPARLVKELLAKSAQTVALKSVQLLAPLDGQEVWAAGVTYKRSKVAREAESEAAATFYDKVYTAARPELFLKSTGHHLSGPGGPVRIRRDSKWNVPEPELTLVLSPKMKLVGFTIGNDMSSRDIEGENPLYLPQAKIYDYSCALGPVITLAEAMPSAEATTIRLRIDRGGKTVFDGETRLSQMARSFEDLIGWLGRENTFPQGVLLLTGTGIVPPDDFTLAAGDVVRIEITGIGELVNLVEMRS